jgi:hypothetical protein
VRSQYSFTLAAGNDILQCSNLFHNNVIEFVTNRPVCYCFKLQVVTQWLSVLVGSRKSLQHFTELYSLHIIHLLFFQSIPSPPVCTAQWGLGSLARCLQTGYWAVEWSELWTGGQTLVHPTRSVCNIIMDDCEGYSTFCYNSSYRSQRLDFGAWFMKHVLFE